MNMAEQQHLDTPHSIEAEQAVLGALMRDNGLVDRIGNLEAKHFFREDHRAIFAEIMLLIARGQPADVMTVWPALEARGGPVVDGLAACLNQLQQSVPSAANVAQYAKTVVDRSMCAVCYGWPTRSPSWLTAPKARQSTRCSTPCNRWWARWPSGACGPRRA